MCDYLRSHGETRQAGNGASKLGIHYFSRRDKYWEQSRSFLMNSYQLINRVVSCDTRVKLLASDFSVVNKY